MTVVKCEFYFANAIHKNCELFECWVVCEGDTKHCEDTTRRVMGSKLKKIAERESNSFVIHGRRNMCVCIDYTGDSDIKRKKITLMKTNNLNGKVRKGKW